MSALAAESVPYPDACLSIIDALAALPPEDPAEAWFSPAAALDEPAPAAAVPAGPVFTPLRHPGASLAARPVPVPAAGQVTNVVVLARVAGALKKSMRTPAELADELARHRLAGIVFAAARHAEPPYGPYCPDCKASDPGWCEPCDRAREKSEALDRLHDLILAADTYATAAVLVASAPLYAEGGAR